MENFLTRAFLRPLIARPCFNCGLSPKEPWFLLCPSCAEEAGFVRPEGRCPLCLNSLDAHGHCSGCDGRKNFWDGCGAFLDYQDYISRELFTKYKFEASLAAEKDLAALLAPGLEPLRGQTALVLPCGKKTLSALGFHPLVKILEHFRIEAVQPFLKTGAKAQKDLSARERRERRDFIALKDGYRPPQSVLLMDDVMTTGSTFNEGARLLKERGAESVRILALLRD